jgi:hypothetical protein
MDLVWDKLLPSMKEKALPEDAVARQKLEGRIAGLKVKVQAGDATAPLAANVSGRWYELAENDRGVKAVSLDFKSGSSVLAVRTDSGESRIPIGLGNWSARTKVAFANGIERFLSVPTPPLLAASGGWTAADTFTVKLVASETPFYSVMKLRFEGDAISIESDHNVAFGLTKLPRLSGKAAISSTAR